MLPCMIGRMKPLALCIAVLAVSAGAFAAVPGGTDAAAATPGAQAPAAGADPLATQKDRMSYSVGVTTGRALRTADGAEVNFDALILGLKDGLEAAHLRIPERQVNELLGLFQQSLRQKMSASRARAKVENMEAAHKFLDGNKSQPGIVTLDGGTQYRILKSGTGRLPTESDVVTVQYRGTLLNGNEFDATEPGAPAHLQVASLVAGWKQVLKLMPVGSHWQVYIPPELGYGERGIGANIGPNELLVFDLELLDTHPSTLER